MKSTILHFVKWDSSTYMKNQEEFLRKHLNDLKNLKQRLKDFK